MSGEPKVEKMITLRCSACNAQVNVSFRTSIARCMCGNVWHWKREPKRISMTTARELAGRP